MNFAIYARVSTAQQAEHGYSLQTQVDACTKKAMELGATSVKNYIDDGYSGAYLERPALDNLRDAVAQKLHDCVVIYDIDRRQGCPRKNYFCGQAEFYFATHQKSHCATEGFFRLA